MAATHRQALSETAALSSRALGVPNRFLTMNAAKTRRVSRGPQNRVVFYRPHFRSSREKAPRRPSCQRTFSDDRYGAAATALLGQLNHQFQGLRRRGRGQHLAGGRWWPRWIAAESARELPERERAAPSHRPNRPPELLGARGGTRTHTSLRKGDFKSPASTIPPPGRRHHSVANRPHRREHVLSEHFVFPSTRLPAPSARGLERNARGSSRLASSAAPAIFPNSLRPRWRSDRIRTP
jgi:hypothetical protein